MPSSQPKTDPLRAEVLARLDPFIEGFEDPRLGTFMALCAGRVMFNAARRGTEELRSVPADSLRHVADWLKSAILNDEDWLRHVDDKGRPRKLMKFSTMTDIVREADKAMLVAAQRSSSLKIVEGDEELIAELGDGFHIVRLLTPAALDGESGTMQHCIGNGGYDERLAVEHFVYLSLRDAAGKPHATLEIEDGRIVQLQGKQNKPPVAKYLHHLVPFIQERGYPVDVPVSHMGYVIDVEGKWHPLDRLPDGLTICGNLDLDGPSITSLPDDLTVEGDLFLINTSITSLPDGLKLGGDLVIRGTSITSLPDGLNVGKYLDIRNTSITSLPDGLKVGRGILANEAEVLKLPDSISDMTGIYTHRGWISAARFRELHAEEAECSL